MHVKFLKRLVYCRVGPALFLVKCRRRYGGVAGPMFLVMPRMGSRGPMATADGPFHYSFATELPPTFRAFPAGFHGILTPSRSIPPLPLQSTQVMYIPRPIGTKNFTVYTTLEVTDRQRPTRREEIISAQPNQSISASLTVDLGVSPIKLCTIATAADPVRKYVHMLI